MKQLAILIPTLPIRIDKYAYLLKKINKQIVDNNLINKIQIVTLCDTKDYLIGYKRNFLVNLSLSKYICFVDDDDDISDSYVVDIYNATLKGVDCVTFLGEYVSYNDTRSIDMSINNKYDYDTIECYYRIPNHLSVVKREIALKCPFPNLQYGEDSEYSKLLKKHLKTEYQIKKKLYFYNFDANTSQTLPNSNVNQFKENK